MKPKILSQPVVVWILMLILFGAVAIPATAQNATNQSRKVWGAPVFDRVMSIAVTNPMVPVAGPVNLLTSIKYIGKDEAFVPSPFLFGYEYNLQVSYKGKAVELSKDGKSHFKCFLGSACIDYLQPNQEYAFNVPLDKWFVLEKPGEYHVSGTWAFREPGNWDHGTNCVSNEIIITVKDSVQHKAGG